MASHLARFQSDDSLLGECDPWAGIFDFFTPRGPGRAAYRPDGPLPKEFPRVRDVTRSNHRCQSHYWCFVPWVVVKLAAGVKGGTFRF